MLSATDVAVAVTMAGEGAFVGAVYVTAAPEALAAADSVPHAEPEQPTPPSIQVTPLFCASFCTVAARVCVCPVCTEALAGDTATTIAAGAVLIAACAIAIFVGCACEIAAIVTVDGEGTAGGAVYKPVASIVPFVGSPPVTPLTCQMTAVSEVLATEAVNFCFPETGTEVLVGVTVILTPWALSLGSNEEPALAHPQAIKAITRNSVADRTVRKRTKQRSAIKVFLKKK